MQWTKRELQEIYHALFYEETTKHGTVGHNQLLIIAKLAKQAGFNLLREDNKIVLCYLALKLGHDNYWLDDEIELDNETLQGAKLGLAMGNEFMRGFIDGLNKEIEL